MLFTHYVTLQMEPSSHGFRVGMKLEAVDKENTHMICVATVRDVLGDHVLVHFDEWEDIYDYWCDAGSPLLHPIGWCHTNGALLSAPKSKTRNRRVKLYAIAVALVCVCFQIGRIRRRSRGRLT